MSPLCTTDDHRKPLPVPSFAIPHVRTAHKMCRIPDNAAQSQEYPIRQVCL